MKGQICLAAVAAGEYYYPPGEVFLEQHYPRREYDDYHEARPHRRFRHHHSFAEEAQPALVSRGVMPAGESVTSQRVLAGGAPRVRSMVTADNGIPGGQILEAGPGFEEDVIEGDVGGEIIEPGTGMAGRMRVADNALVGAVGAEAGEEMAFSNARYGAEMDEFAHMGAVRGGIGMGRRVGEDVVQNGDMLDNMSEFDGRMAQNEIMIDQKVAEQELIAGREEDARAGRRIARRARQELIATNAEKARGRRAVQMEEATRNRISQERNRRRMRVIQEENATARIRALLKILNQDVKVTQKDSERLKKDAINLRRTRGKKRRAEELLVKTRKELQSALDQERLETARLGNDGRLLIRDQQLLREDRARIERDRKRLRPMLTMDKYADRALQFADDDDMGLDRQERVDDLVVPTGFIRIEEDE